MPNLHSQFRGSGRYIFYLTTSGIETIEVAAGAAAIDDKRIRRIGKNVTAFTRAHRMPIAKSNEAIVASADNRCSPAVLLRAVDPVRKLIVDGDVVELRRRLVVPAGPGASTIQCHDRAL